jgi:hypothetical protein
MTQQMTHQIALITVFATCITMVALVVGFGLGADSGAALQQAAPLALICAIGLTILLADPFRSRSHE